MSQSSAIVQRVHKLLKQHGKAAVVEGLEAVWEQFRLIVEDLG